jgi:hypothetical protein
VRLPFGDRPVLDGHVLHRDDGPVGHHNMGDAARRRAPAQHRRPGIDVVLDMPVALTDIGFVPRQMGVPEHHDVSVGEPLPESLGPTSGWPAVVDHRHATALDVDRQSLRKLVEGNVVVAAHRVQAAVRHVQSQSIEDAGVRDVAGVKDQVGPAQVARDPVDQAVSLVSARSVSFALLGAHSLGKRNSARPDRLMELSAPRSIGPPAHPRSADGDSPARAPL